MTIVGAITTVRFYLCLTWTWNSAVAIGNRDNIWRHRRHSMLQMLWFTQKWTQDGQKPQTWWNAVHILGFLMISSPIQFLTFFLPRYDSHWARYPGRVKTSHSSSNFYGILTSYLIWLGSGSYQWLPQTRICVSNRKNFRSIHWVLLEAKKKKVKKENYQKLTLLPRGPETNQVFTWELSKFFPCRSCTCKLAKADNIIVMHI